MAIVLRDYQQAAVDEIRLKFRQKLWPVLFVLPTGGGKTFTFSYIANSAAGKGNRTIIIVHRKELLLQASKSLTSLGVEHGVIAPYFTPDPHQRVQVASIDTLIKRLEKGEFDFDLIIFDEAHHVTADNKWGRVFVLLTQKEREKEVRMLGVTATPIRGDGKGLGIGCGGVFKSIVLGPSSPELIERGALINPVVYSSLDVVDLTGLNKNKDGDYVANAALADRVDKPKITGSAVDQYRKVCPGARAIVFCVNIEHARHVVEEFNKAGYRAALLVGEPAMPGTERTAVVKGLAAGTIDIAVTVDLVSEGFDIPGLECCIMLRPTASEGLFLQQVGRIMRPAPGKAGCWLLDHVGNVGAMIDGEFVLKHGFPDQHREWSLEGRKKRKGKGSDGPTVPAKQCPKCWVVHVPAPSCPVCGHIYPVPGARQLEQVDGELVEITQEMKAKISRDRRFAVARAETLEELEAIGAAYGYHKNWAGHVFTAKQRKKANNRGRSA